MRQLALVLAIAACSPQSQTQAVQVATDLLTPAQARCAEARGIYDEIAAETTPRPDAEMARLRVYVLAACLE